MDLKELKELYIHYKSEKLLEIVYLENDNYNEEAITVVRNILKDRGIRNPPEEIVKRMSEKQPAKNKELPAKQTELVRVFTTMQSMEAGLVKGILEADGIKVFLEDQFLLGTMPYYGVAVEGIKLVVPKDEENRALEILADYQRSKESPALAQEKELTGERINPEVSKTEESNKTVTPEPYSQQQAAEPASTDTENIVTDSNNFSKSLISIIKLAVIVAVLYLIVSKML